MHHGTSAGNATGVGGLLASSRCLTSEYSAGITTRVNTVDETMPPTIGAAMRRIPSEPVPLLHMIGSTIGKASCRETVCKYVYISVIAVSLKKKNHKAIHNNNH